MTEEAPKITSAIKTPREKNPGRVTAGKRLAAISKEAKERKKLERENSCDNDNSETQKTTILVGGLVAAVVALYYLKFHNTDNTTEKPPQKEETSLKFQAYSMDD